MIIMPFIIQSIPFCVGIIYNKQCGDISFTSRKGDEDGQGTGKGTVDHIRGP